MNKLEWMEDGNLQGEMSNYKMSKMEEGNSLTPPPHGYLYYKNPPTEKKLSESQKQKTQTKRDDDAKQINDEKYKPINKKNPPDPKPLKPITKEEENEGINEGINEYDTRENQGLTFGGKKKRKSRKQRRRTNKNKKRKTKRKYIKHCK